MVLLVMVRARKLCSYLFFSYFTETCRAEPNRLPSQKVSQAAAKESLRTISRQLGMDGVSLSLDFPPFDVWGRNNLVFIHTYRYSLDGGRRPPPPSKRINFEEVEGVGCMALITTPMLRRCIIAGTKERFEGHTPSATPPKLYLLARGVVAHQSDASARGAMPRVGRQGGISAVGGHGCDCVL
jgi:hypothetical protein